MATMGEITTLADGTTIDLTDVNMDNVNLSNFKHPRKYGIFNITTNGDETLVANFIDEKGLVASHLRRKAKEWREAGCEDVELDGTTLNFTMEGSSFTVKEY